MSGALKPLRIAIGIATAGRPDILIETLRIIERQVRRPDRIVVCAPTDSDVGPGIADLSEVDIYFGVRGLPAQRNVILDRTADCDIVLFIDDDFILDDDYVANLERLHLANPSMVMFTGNVLRDGVTSGGISLAEALAALAADDGITDPVLEVLYNGYGCNMSVHRDVAMREGIRFDEKLPLYGWLEDVDFSRSLARFGCIARSQELRGVHLGVKGGRQRGLRLGYSQIANPIYILCKGNFTLLRAMVQIGRNISANLLRSFRPEPHIDRRGRVQGNVIAISDFIRGRLSPRPYPSAVGDLTGILDRSD